MASSSEVRRLKALAHPIRLGMMQRLAAVPEICACDLGEAFDQYRLGHPIDREHGVAALLGDGLPARSLMEMLQTRAAGNPYYLEEMVRWALAHDAVRRSGLQWLPVPGRDEELPPNLEAALRERTRGLDTLSRQVLEWLVVAKERVGFPLLAAVTGALVRPFVLIDRYVPAVRRHGYLLATVVVKPKRPC